MRGDRVKQSELFDVAGLQAVDRGTGEHAVGCAGVDLGRAADLDDGLGRVAQGAGGVDHVVKEDALLTGNVADDVHDLALVGLLAALVDDGETHVQLLGEHARTGDGAHVGGDDNHVLAAVAELSGVVVDEYGIAEEVVHGDIKEALDLRGMQVHGQHAVRTGGHEHVGNELRGDGVAGLGLAVLTGIAEIGDDRGDAAGGGAAACIDQDQQLHEVVVDRLAGGLDQKHVAAANGFIHGDGDFAVREALDLHFTELHADDLADVLCQLGVGIAGEDLDVFAVRNHGGTLLFRFCC